MKNNGLANLMLAIELMKSSSKTWANIAKNLSKLDRSLLEQIGHLYDECDSPTDVINQIENDLNDKTTGGLK